MTMRNVACYLALPFHHPDRSPMALSMYSQTVPVFVRLLGNLSAILDKTAQHCTEKNIEPSVLLNSRLFPDMFPLTRQVQLASDFAKGGAARLAGLEVP